MAVINKDEVKGKWEQVKRTVKDKWVRRREIEKRRPKEKPSARRGSGRLGKVKGKVSDAIED